MQLQHGWLRGAVLTRRAERCRPRGCSLGVSGNMRTEDAKLEQWPVKGAKPQGALSSGYGAPPFGAYGGYPSEAAYMMVRNPISIT